MKFTLSLLVTAAVFALAGASVYRFQNQTAFAKAETSANFPKAPELVGGPWLNTNGKSLTLASRRGKVTIVEFWTFGCSNCRANLPAYANWNKRFAGKGVEIIGVHTPEFDSESKLENVKAQVKQLGIEYPVLLDNQKKNWSNWNQRYWPAIYVIDKNGRIREKWEGELEYGNAKGTAKLTATIEKLLAENGPELKTNMKNQDKSFSVTKTDAQWREELTPEQYKVLRQAGTEAPFTGELLKNHESGVYECAACGQALFNSDTKFDSGTGWPSFYQAIPGSIKEIKDGGFGMARTETVCSQCGGHLGHVFDDGPNPTGLRYCMNSAALEFEKK